MPNLEMVYDIKNLDNSKNAEAIKNSVSALKGVNNVKVDFDGNKVIVDILRE
jgi:copper chaperone CopZ